MHIDLSYCLLYIQLEKSNSWSTRFSVHQVYILFSLLSYQVYLSFTMNYEHLISDLIFQHLLEFPHKNGELWLYEKFHKSIIFKSSLGNGIKIRSLTIINLFSMYICYKDKSCSLEITEIAAWNGKNKTLTRVHNTMLHVLFWERKTLTYRSQWNQ